jgi:4-amino-4-deoxy-L-arabinose transferase-like glycosyltransferase
MPHHFPAETDLNRPGLTKLAPSTPVRATAWLVTIVTLLHLLVAGRVGLGTDEAHYALYGLHLAWSYFDHPPMVGWLQALVLPFSQSDLALRLMPMVLLAASSAVLYRLTRTLFPEESPWLGFTAVALLHSGFVFNAMGVLMLPEDPLLLFGLLAILTLQHAVRQPTLRRWALFGLSMGLLGLSKYTAILIVPGVALYFAWERQWRLLRTPGPWLAMILAAIVVSPVFIWNAQHQWMSIAYQWHHGTVAPHWDPLRLLISQAVQLVAYGPGLYIGGYLAVARGLRRGTDPATRLLLSLSLPMLLFFAWNSGHVETLPHWTALGWAGLTPLAARLLWQHRHRLSWRISAGAALTYSVVLILLVHSLLFTPWLKMPNYRNPLAEVIGWNAAAKHALVLRAQMAKTPGPAPVLFTGYWTEAARLAWYARPEPLVVTDRNVDQFDLWFGSPQNGQRGIYIVSHNSRHDPRTHGPDSFSRCDRVDSLDIVVHQQILNTFYYYRCSGYRRGTS